MRIVNYYYFLEYPQGKTILIISVDCGGADIMPFMNDKLFQIIEKLENRINAYWNFYTLVILGVCGWVFANDDPFKIKEKFVLTVSLSLFFLTNISVIRATTIKASAFEKEISEISKEVIFNSTGLKNTLVDKSMPGRLTASYILHFICYVLVILIIWFDY